MTVKCPKCKKEIWHMKEWQSGEASYWFRLIGEEKEAKYEYAEFMPDDRTNDYECPECGETLARSEKDAIKILKG